MAQQPFDGMWLPAPVPSDDELRQGDLLLTIPFAVNKSEPNGHGMLEWQTKTRAAIVIEQCCNIESDNVVRLAKVSLRRDTSGKIRQTLRITDPEATVWWPSAQTFVRYTPRFLAIDWAEGLPNPNDDRCLVAELLRTIEYDHDLAWLRAKRVARMTPHARAVLREKLALLVGRVERDDAEVLAASRL